jgi:hypothetical protein
MTKIEGDVPWHDRADFFAIGSRIMRRIVADHAGVNDLSGGVAPALDAARCIDP